jgi:hypothetical protein
MSAIGPWQTSATALHMSAFRSKADMPVAELRFCGYYGGKADMPFCVAYLGL